MTMYYSDNQYDCLYPPTHTSIFPRFPSHHVTYLLVPLPAYDTTNIHNIHSVTCHSSQDGIVPTSSLAPFSLPLSLSLESRWQQIMYIIVLLDTCNEVFVLSDSHFSPFLHAFFLSSFVNSNLHMCLALRSIADTLSFLFV